MINNTSNFEENRQSQEANGPRISSSKLKDYGQKSLTPILEVFHKYQSDVEPYFTALADGLQSGADALRGSDKVNTVDSSISSVTQNQAATSRDPKEFVAGWFSDAANWLNTAKDKMKSSDAKALIGYVEEEARKNPGFIFSASYLAGIIFGRLGRHIGRQATKGKVSSTNEINAQTNVSGLADEDSNFGEQSLPH